MPVERKDIAAYRVYGDGGIHDIRGTGRLRIKRDDPISGHRGAV